MKHKHYDCIVAWASGKKIEFRRSNEDSWEIADCPKWHECCEYRVKKEPVVTVKYFYQGYHMIKEFAVPAYIEFTPDLEKWDLKITYHDDVAVKVELPNGERNE